jgi:hypothetical protein
MGVLFDILTRLQVRIKARPASGAGRANIIHHAPRAGEPPVAAKPVAYRMTISMLLSPR